MRRTFARLVVVVALLLLMLNRSQVAYAATIVVNSVADIVADDGQCTLREALIAVNTATASGVSANECIAGSGADVISFSIGSGAKTILLSGALGELPTIAKPVTLDGSTQPGFTGTPLITIDAGTNYQVFHTRSSGTITFQYLVIQRGDAPIAGGFGGGINAFLLAGSSLVVDHCTVQNNTALSGAGDGGGIYAEADLGQGFVTIKNSTISGNQSRYGAGVYNNVARLDIINSLVTQNVATIEAGGVYAVASNFSTTNLTNSTIENNTAVSEGGGLFVEARATVNVTASTISNNRAGDAGGVYVTGSTGLNVQNSLFAYNQATGTTNANISGAINSLGYNLFDNLVGASLSGDTTGNLNPPVDPLLGPLQNNGGATLTRALLTGSPALDKIPPVNGCNNANTSTDQRGAIRPDVVSGLCDIGAVEGQALPSTPTLTSTPTPTSTLTPSATLTNTITSSATTTPSLTNTNTYTPSVTSSSTVTPSLTNTNTYTPSVTSSVTITPSVTSSATPTPSRTASYTPSITLSATLTSSVTSSATITPSVTSSSTVTPSLTATLTPTSSLTVTPTASWTNTPTITPSPTTVLGRPDTIGIYSDGVFYLRNQNSSGAPDITVAFGGAGCLPVVGDWNGDGVDTIGIYISELGVFLLRDSNTPGNPDYGFVMGNPGDEPLAGKWDASMRGSGVGVYRPSNGLLFAKSRLVNGFADYTMVLGNPGDHGIAGDWDSNGYDSMGVFRPVNTRFYLANAIGGTMDLPAIIFSDYDFVYGPADSLPIAGDWTGAGPSRVGYVMNGAFYLKNTMSGGAPDAAFAYGSPGMWPVAGKWTKGSVPAPPVIVHPTVSTNDNPGKMD